MKISYNREIAIYQTQEELKGEVSRKESHKRVISDKNDLAYTSENKESESDRHL